MSLGLYPVFEPKLPGTRLEALGEALAGNVGVLDRIARKAKLTPITAFADNRPVPDDFDGDPDDLAEVLGPWTEWFDPADGRVAFAALADHIRANPKAASRLDDAAVVLEELDETVRVLAVAETGGVRFRLQMS